MRPHVTETLVELAGHLFAGRRAPGAEDEFQPQPRTTQVTVAATGSWSQLTALR